MFVVDRIEVAGMFVVDRIEVAGMLDIFVVDRIEVAGMFVVDRIEVTAGEKRSIIIGQSRVAIGSRDPARERFWQAVYGWLLHIGSVIRPQTHNHKMLSTTSN